MEEKRNVEMCLCTRMLYATAISSCLQQVKWGVIGLWVLAAAKQDGKEVDAERKREERQGQNGSLPPTSKLPFLTSHHSHSCKWPPLTLFCLTTVPSTDIYIYIYIYIYFCFTPVNCIWRILEERKGSFRHEVRQSSSSATFSPPKFIL